MTKQDKPSGESGEARVSHWLVSVCFTIIGLIAIFVDPLGLGRDFKLSVQDFVMRTMLAPPYGSSADTTHQVSVALLRESSLRVIAESFQDAFASGLQHSATQDPESGSDQKLPWPLPLSMHARILDAIVSLGPKAVFVDILFLDERPNDGANILKDFLLRTYGYSRRSDSDPVKALGVPIFFAKDPDEETHMRRDLVDQRCYDLDAQAWPDEVREECTYFSEHLLPVPKRPENGILRTYYTNSEKDADKSGELTTAFVLLKRLDLLSEWTKEEKNGLGPASSDLEIVWGSTPHKTNAKWMGEREKLGQSADDQSNSAAPQTTSERTANEAASGEEYRRIPCRSIAFPSFAAPCKIVRWFANLIFRPHEAFMQTCPYVATVPVESLLFWHEDPDVPDLIKEKVVFYGVDLRGVSDVVYPPIHERLPGVYIHAMALDNLLTQGPDYLRKLNSSWTYVLEVSALLYLAGLLAVFWKRSNSSENGLRSQLCLGLAYLTLSFAPLVVTAWILTSWADVAPGSWVGLFGLWVGPSVLFGYKLTAALVQEARQLAIGSWDSLKQTISNAKR